MINVAEYLPPLIQQGMKRTRTFIAQRGGLSYCLSPKGQTCQAEALFKAYYDEQLFEGWGYATTLSWQMPRGAYTLAAGLDNIRYLLCLLADQPAWLERLRTVDGQADDETVVRALGIDPAATCRPSVKGWSEGTFLAPDAGGYAYFLVEPYGQVSVISRSAQLLPVAFHLAADKESERVDIAGRLGKMGQALDDDGRTA